MKFLWIGIAISCGIELTLPEREGRERDGEGEPVFTPPEREERERDGESAPVLTPRLSLQIYNTSGHFFMQFDIDTRFMYAEEAKIVEDASTRVVVGLSAFAPVGFGMADQRDRFYGAPGMSSEVKKMVTYSYMTRPSTLFVNGSNTSSGYEAEKYAIKQGKLQSLSWGNAGTVNKMPDAPIVQRNNISVGPGLNFVSLVAQQTTIPVAEETYPLYSHVDGHGYINVLGGPFVDAPSMSCKWKILSRHCEYLSKVAIREFAAQCLVYALDAIYVNATYIVCVTPPLPMFQQSGALAEMTISLSGVIWSTPTNETFVFFTTGNPVGRLPLFGSSKGLNVLKVQGLNLKRLSWDQNTNILKDSRCEFGEHTNKRTYMTDNKMTFNAATCQDIKIGPSTEEYCAFTCKSPQIPHEMCVYEGPYRLCPQDAKLTPDQCDHLCKGFVPECPKGVTNRNDMLGMCRPLVDLNLNIPFRLGRFSR